MSYNNLSKEAAFFATAASVMKTITFRPGEVDDWIITALDMAGITGEQYKYHETGSKVSFSPAQYIRFIRNLKDILDNDELVSQEEKDSIMSTIKHISTQIPNA
jgi:hypothetical protein